MPRKTKADLENELVTAQDRIRALEAELATQGHRDDMAPDWADLRAALEGRVSKDADHWDLVHEAADIVREFDTILESVDTKSVDIPDWLNLLKGREWHEVSEAIDLYERMPGEGELGIALWRAGKIGVNDDPIAWLRGVVDVF